jgi:hypothetical protein
VAEQVYENYSVDLACTTAVAKTKDIERGSLIHVVHYPRVSPFIRFSLYPTIILHHYLPLHNRGIKLLYHLPHCITNSPESNGINTMTPIFIMEAEG